MTVILLNKNQVTFVSKSNTHRIDLSIAEFVRVMQDSKHIKFLKELTTNPNITFMYNHLNDYHFFNGFVKNIIQSLEG